MKDELRSVDALVRHTVRRALFPGLRTPRQPTPSPVQTAIAAVTPVESFKGPLPFAVGDHYAHVLSYASWSDVQLQEERRRLKAFLRQQEKKRHERPEDDGAMETDALKETVAREAFALLELFLRERRHNDATDAKGSARPVRHAQLALFAQYHEKCHGRKILHALDVVSIQKTYEVFLENQ